jgi:hypothetical protein
MNLWGIGFSYTKLIEVFTKWGFRRITTKTIFFFCSYTYCTVLYDFFMVVVLK